MGGCFVLAKLILSLQYCFNNTDCAKLCSCSSKTVAATDNDSMVIFRQQGEGLNLGPVIPHPLPPSHETPHFVIHLRHTVMRRPVTVKYGPCTDLKYENQEDETSTPIGREQSRDESRPMGTVRLIACSRDYFSVPRAGRDASTD